MKTIQRMRFVLACVLSAVVLLLGAMPSLQASDILFYTINKTEHFWQGDSGLPVERPLVSPVGVHPPWHARAQVYFSAPTNYYAAYVGAQGSPNNEMELSDDGLYLEYLVGAMTRAEIDASVPDGAVYSIEMNTAHDGTHVADLRLAGPEYPVPAHINNYADLQGVNPGADFSIRWDPQVNGRGGDFIGVFISDMVTGSNVFHAPLPGQANALRGTDLSVTIPAGTLRPGVTCVCDVVFSKVKDTNSTAYPGALGLAFYGTVTEFLFTTSTSSVPAAPEVWQFTTYAGKPSKGSIDGPGNVALFADPAGIALDNAGNIFVADCGNFAIRKISPAGVVSTFAGVAMNSGSVDGSGAAARFAGPNWTAADSQGNLYVTDGTTIRKITPAGVVSTLAGVAGQSGYTDGSGSSARFNSPQALAIDSAGNLYVCDGGYPTRIRKVTPSGSVSTLSISGYLTFCHGLAIDGATNLYVTDNFTVRQITPTGTVITLAGANGMNGTADGAGSAARFFSPQGVTLGRDGNLYLCDPYTIRKVVLAGTNSVVSTLAGVALQAGGNDGLGSAARFSYMTAGIATDANGDFLLADRGNNAVRKITAAGQVTTVAGTPASANPVDGALAGARFATPKGVAVGADGTVYVAENNSVVRKISPSGQVSTLAGAPGNYGAADGVGTNASLGNPAALALDAAGNLFVADFNSTIRKITPEGVVTTVAGMADTPGSVDGPGSAARFKWPQGLALDQAGNIYVADTQNHAIRKITPAGEVSTLAGLLGTYGSSNGLGTNARFSSPSSVVVDSANYIYVADTQNQAIRRITPEGVVSTLAGLMQTPGTNDGFGSMARHGFEEFFPANLDRRLHRSVCRRKTDKG